MSNVVDQSLQLLVPGATGGAVAGSILLIVLKYLIDRHIEKSDTFKRQVSSIISQDPTLKAIRHDIDLLRKEDQEIKTFYIERLSIQIDKQADFQHETSERLSRLESTLEFYKEQLNRIENKLDAR